MGRFLLPLALALLAVCAVPRPAGALGLYEYYDAHPFPLEVGRWCYEEGHHLHTFELDPDVYPVMVVDDVTFFVGDAVAFGADFDAVWYWGNHPIGHVGGLWCVLDGPHSHYWRPWWNSSRYSAGYWTVRDGYWGYIGPYDDWYAWSYRRYHDSHWGIQTRVVVTPYGYSRYRGYVHPGGIYISGRLPAPSWERRSEADRYRSSVVIRVDPNVERRYGTRPRTRTPERRSTIEQERSERSRTYPSARGGSTGSTRGGWGDSKSDSGRRDGERRESDRNGRKR